jgi:hypothetical protein
MDSNGVTTMSRLTVPTEEQATRFTRELDFDDRFAGYLYKASGQMAVTVYSLGGAIGFLASDNTESTVEAGSQFLGRNVDVAYMQPKALAGWLREAVGDAELADAIEAAAADISEDEGYPPQMRAMRDLMIERFVQCMDVLGLAREAAEGPAAEPDGQGGQEAK